jgi:hypothetical protein
MRILVVPERLNEMALAMRRASLELEEALLALRRAWASLDWEVRQSPDIEALFVQAQRQAMALQEEAERLGRFLEARAAAFSQADAEGSASLTQTAAAFRALSLAATSTLPLAATFPSARAEGYARLGTLLPGSPFEPLVRLTRVPVEAEERRALLDFGADFLISKIEPLGTLKDLWDLTRIPAWNAQVNQAVAAWEQARRQFGAASPQAQAAYGQYLDTLLFQMPLVGTAARAFLSLLKILGRANPVE